MKVQTDISQINHQHWQFFVNNHPDGTVFQGPAMYALFDRAKNFNPVVLVAEEEGTIRGILLAVIIREFGGPFGFFSSRTVVYGGPLVEKGRPDRDQVVSALLKTLIKKVKHRSIFIQFRNFADREKDKTIFRKFGFRHFDRLNYLVDTTAESLVKKRMSASKQRQVKKGQKNGAEIIAPENEQQVRDFYNILHHLYKYKVKKPLPDYSFFHHFYELSKDNGLGIIRLIKYNEKIIGGILAPVQEGKVIYEWYVCGLDQEFKHCYPSVLATWAPMEYALENNIDCFDFMGVGTPEKDYGVREFKSKFGGELVNFGRFGRVNNQVLFAITEIGYNLLALFRKI